MKYSGSPNYIIVHNITHNIKETFWAKELCKYLSEIGLGNNKFKDLSVNRKKEVIANLQKIIRNEIVSRGYPLYLEDSISLTKEGNTEMVLMEYQHVIIHYYY